MIRECWRFIDTGPGNATWNMAVGEGLLRECERGWGQPVLHFYSWLRPAITLGYLQRLKNTVYMDRCRAEGVEVVRRITGGRAMVHTEDISYSLIFPARGGVVPRGILSSYLKIAQGFVYGLKRLGIEAELIDKRGPGVQRGVKGQGAVEGRREIPACFLTRIRHEVQYKGRKIMGAAQRRIGDWVLQQGTIMIDLDCNLWYHLLRYPVGMDYESVRAALLVESVSVNEALGIREEIPYVKDALLGGLSESLGVEFIANSLSPDEEEAVRCLEEERYCDLLGQG